MQQTKTTVIRLHMDNGALKANTRRLATQVAQTAPAAALQAMSLTALPWHP